MRLKELQKVMPKVLQKVMQKVLQIPQSFCSKK